MKKQGVLNDDGLTVYPMKQSNLFEARSQNGQRTTSNKNINKHVEQNTETNEYLGKEEDDKDKSVPLKTSCQLKGRKLMIKNC